MLANERARLKNGSRLVSRSAEEAGRSTEKTRRFFRTIKITAIVRRG